MTAKFTHREREHWSQRDGYYRIGMSSVIFVCQKTSSKKSTGKQLLLSSSGIWIHPGTLPKIAEAFKEARRTRMGPSLHEISQKLSMMPAGAGFGTPGPIEMTVTDKCDICKTKTLTGILQDGDPDFKNGDVEWRQPPPDPRIQPIWKPFDHSTQEAMAYNVFPGQAGNFLWEIPPCLKCCFLYRFSNSNETCECGKLRTLYPDSDFRDFGFGYIANAGVFNQ